jgi:LPXTG-site transpeptidase (sortase) family protein
LPKPHGGRPARAAEPDSDRATTGVHRNGFPLAAWSALLLIGLGLVLIAVFIAARLVLALQHEADLVAFRDPSPLRPAGAPAANALPAAADRAVLRQNAEGGGAEARADQTLWSAERVRAHSAALELDSTGTDLRPPIEGVLRVPTLDLEVVVYEGSGERALDRGAGRIDGTPPLGSAGNVGIAAHRDGFFRSLKDIEVGDEILVELARETLRYEVVKILIVKPEDTWVLAPTDEPTLTLVTCYPFYFVGPAPERFIAQARTVRHPW